MREIKFKAKRKSNNEWVYGYLVEYTFKDTIYMDGTSPKQSYIFPMDERSQLKSLEKRIEVIPETISEYTGLKDKNGVEIYENDIVKVNERYKGLGETDLLYKVDYVSRLAKYVYNPLIVNGKYDNNNNDVDLYIYETNDIEVIGNIYDKEVE